MGVVFNPRYQVVPEPIQPRRSLKVWAIVGLARVTHITTGMKDGGCVVNGSYMGRRGVARTLLTARAVGQPIARVF